MSDLLEDAAKRASRYLKTLGTRSVAPGNDAVVALAGFDRAFPTHTSSAESVLAELDEIDDVVLNGASRMTRPSGGGLRQQSRQR